MKLRVWLLLALAALLLPACNKTWAPVEDRSSTRSEYQVENDGRYRVRKGDSLHAIAFNFGLDWRQIAGWNGIEAPYTIYPGQELLLSPQAKRSSSVTTTGTGPRPSSAERSVPRETQAESTASRSSQVPVQQQPAQKTASTTAPPARSAPAPSTSSSRPAQGKATSTADPARWLWPAEGRLLSTFKSNDPTRNGIEISGKEGQAIKASAAGEVVYSGSGLIGYGELIIIKHSDRMLSAYAHNRSRLVAEGQAVSAGEKIAEMGRDERNRVLLHFEIRRDGNPRDPMQYLPRR